MARTWFTWCMTGWRRFLWAGYAAGAAVALISPAHAQGPCVPAPPTSASSSARQAALPASYLSMPLRFEPNQGQSSASVQFLSSGAGFSLFLTPADAVFSLRSPQGSSAAVHMTLPGANPLAPVTGLEPFTSHSSYLVGSDPRKWRSNVPDYARVRYQDLYPGIDLTFYGNQQHLEYDFVVAPGADPRAIRLQFKGASTLRLTPQGQLVLSTSAGSVRLESPVIYQQNPDGSRVPVQGSFALARNQVHFNLGAYDTTRPLVIDPVVSYATFLGGLSNEDFVSDPKTGSYVSGIAVGPDGSVYVVGTTQSTDFPTSTGALATTAPGGLDIFVTKFNPGGTAIVYSTFLGGSGSDFPDGIAIDAAGNVYIAGSTQSTNFPVTAGAIQSTPLTSNTGFVTKLSPTGTALVYSTFLGGTVVTELTAIAVDANLNAYVIGIDNKGFPTTAGAFQTAVPGQENAVVAKLSVDGKSLVYSTYLGGEKVDIARGLAVDTLGNAYIGGYTSSVHFPIVGSAFQPAIASPDGTNDGFVAKLNPAGSALIYSTYFGGTAEDQVDTLTIDPAGNAYIAGLTMSSNLPLATPIQATYGGQEDAFAAKLNPTGSALLYSTYLGGNQPDFATAIAVDALGDAYIGGVTGSTGTSHQFPLLNSLALPQPGVLVTSAFVTEHNPSGTALIYSTYFGAYETLLANALALDTNGNIYITGLTTPPAFTATASAYQQSLKGNSDAYVTKLWPLALTPATLAFPNTAVGSTSAPLTATLTNSGFATLNISGVTIATLRNPANRLARPHRLRRRLPRVIPVHHLHHHRHRHQRLRRSRRHRHPDPAITGSPVPRATAPQAAGPTRGTP